MDIESILEVYMQKKHQADTLVCSLREILQLPYLMNQILRMKLIDLIGCLTMDTHQQWSPSN
jgi:hypothetical protein